MYLRVTCVYRKTESTHTKKHESYSYKCVSVKGPNKHVLFTAFPVTVFWRQGWKVFLPKYIFKVGYFHLTREGHTTVSVFMATEEATSTPPHIQRQMFYSTSFFDRFKVSDGLHFYLLF